MAISTSFSKHQMQVQESNDIRGYLNKNLDFESNIIFVCRLWSQPFLVIFFLLKQTLLEMVHYSLEERLFIVKPLYKNGENLSW